MDICAGGGDCGAGLKHRDDPGHFPVLGRRGHGQNGLAVWTHGRTPDIVQLTADAGELLVPMDSEFTWPLKSTCRQELMDTTLGFWQITAGLFT